MSAMEQAGHDEVPQVATGLSAAGAELSAAELRRFLYRGAAQLEGVRSRYSMVEGRVLFDFLIRGTGAREIGKALTDPQGASRPGKLELF